MKDGACNVASIIASRSLDRSLSRKRRASAGHPVAFALRFARPSLTPSAGIYALVFPENKSRPTECRAYMLCASLLRPCGADRRMRFSRAPAYPSRNYLGRESSSLPRSFPSLLAILRGCSAACPCGRGVLGEKER